jgi:hypothetical protein
VRESLSEKKYDALLGFLQPKSTIDATATIANDAVSHLLLTL